jgi:hypothetical protein
VANNPQLIVLGRRIALGVIAPIALDAGFDVVVVSSELHAVCGAKLKYILQTPKDERELEVGVLPRDAKAMSAELSESRTRVLVLAITADRKRYAEIFQGVSASLLARRDSLDVLIAENGAKDPCAFVRRFMSENKLDKNLRAYPCIVDRMVPNDMQDNRTLRTESHCELAIGVSSQPPGPGVDQIRTAPSVRLFSEESIDSEEQRKLWFFNGVHAIIAILCYSRQPFVYVEEALKNPRIRAIALAYGNSIASNEEERLAVRRNVDRMANNPTRFAANSVLRELRRKMSSNERFVGPVRRLLETENSHSAVLTPAACLGSMLRLVARHPDSIFAAARDRAGMISMELALEGLLGDGRTESRVEPEVKSLVLQAARYVEPQVSPDTEETELARV